MIKKYFHSFQTNKIIQLLVNQSASRKDKFFFVFLSVFISLLRFIKSFVYMRYLEFTELGIITIITTLMGLIGFFHFGLLNGGYRIFASQKSIDDESQINDLVHTFLGLLLILSSLILSVLYIFNIQIIEDLPNLYSLLGLFFGIVTLSNNWIINILSAHMRFKDINSLELKSTIISFFFLIVIPIWGIIGAILVILSKPLSILLLSYYKHSFIRPNKLNFSFKRFKWILSFGFIPFLSGIFVVLNAQIERWSIVAFLDIESLGKFYLPGFYATLFMLVPYAVNRIFFPKAIKDFSHGNLANVKRLLKYYLIVIFSYSISVLLITYYFIEPVISIFLPKHIIGVQYIWYIYPGLVAMLLLQVLEILYNAAVILKPLLWSYMVGTFVMFSSVIFVVNFLQLSLINIAIIKSLTSITILIILSITYFYIKKNIWKVEISKEAILK